MKIEWNKVTWYSRVAAIIIYVGTFALAFYLGQWCGASKAIINQVPAQNTGENQDNVITSATFDCAGGKTINAVFFSEKVALSLSDGRSMLLLQTLSASGARYSNTDESFVFWNTGDTAFIQERDKTTYEDCIADNTNK
ncbi:MAG: MliC family protein [Candidatus Paceibacterota bacterium]